MPVHRPDRQWFVRVHPSAEFSITTQVLQLRGERELYLVEQSLWAELSGEISPRVIHTAINRQGVVFLWPIRLPGEGGVLDNWGLSEREAVELAKSRWVRLASNMSLGAYEVHEALGVLPQPIWPAEKFAALLKIAFRGRLIQDTNHQAIRQLRGLE